MLMYRALPSLGTKTLNPLRGIATFPGFADSMKEVSVAEARELLLMLKDAEPQQVKPALPVLGQKYDGKDRLYLEAIGIAVGHHDQTRRDVILADFDRHFPEWNEKVANLIWELRPPQVMARLEKQVLDPATPIGRRRQVVEIIASYEDTRGGKLLLKALGSDLPLDMRAWAFYHLK